MIPESPSLKSRGQPPSAGREKRDSNPLTNNITTRRGNTPISPHRAKAPTTTPETQYWQSSVILGGEPSESATPCVGNRSFFDLSCAHYLPEERRRIPMRSHAMLCRRSPKPQLPFQPERNLVATRRAVAEASAAALDSLHLCDGDDVDGDRVELEEGIELAGDTATTRARKLTPRCLSRSLVSVSTSSWPLSEFCVKSSAEISGTYWSLRSRSSSWSLNEMPRTGPRWMRFIKCVV